MNFAISIPQYVGDNGFDPGAFGAHLVGAPRPWASRAPGRRSRSSGSARTLAPLEALTYAAACTERLRLGCVVFVLPLHTPVHLAKAISTLDCLSRTPGGELWHRGGRSRPFAAFGLDGEALVARFTEALALMKACWTEREINFDGRFWQLRARRWSQSPTNSTIPPIWIGGNAPAAVRRAVRLGDGFFGAGSQTTAQFAEQVGVRRADLSEQGKNPPASGHPEPPDVHVDDAQARARETIEAALTHHYGRSGLPPVAVAGPPDVCAAGLREVASAGAELLLLNPLVDDAEQIERLAAEVIPQLS